jgi:predicted Zn-dependent peptidase
MILADWSDFLTLDESEINNERGVIMEEVAQRETHSGAMMTQMRR